MNYRREEETGLYFAGDYNLRGRTPKADVDVCFSGNIAVSQVKFLQKNRVTVPIMGNGDTGYAIRCHALNGRTSISPTLQPSVTKS